MVAVDFHIHSTASDGTNSPREVVRLAAKNNLDCIAITDHNTMLGFEEFKKECKKQGIFGITGVEFSVGFNDKEVHLLGYFKELSDELNQRLKNFLDNENNNRLKNIFKIIENLKNFGFDISYDDVLNELPNENTTINRVYIGNALATKGYVKDFKEAFQKYIGEGCVCFEKRSYTDINTVIDLIHELGGLSIIAHPIQYNMSKSDLDELFSLDIDGIEVYHSDHNKAYSEYLLNEAKRRNLYYTIGSDFHGSNKPRVKLGHVSDNPVDLRFLEYFKK